MAEYSTTRTDHYRVVVEAESKEEAQRLLEEDDRYLNDGSYLGSDFGELEED